MRKAVLLRADFNKATPAKKQQALSSLDVRAQVASGTFGPFFRDVHVAGVHNGGLRVSVSVINYTGTAVLPLHVVGHTQAGNEKKKIGFRSGIFIGARARRVARTCS